MRGESLDVKSEESQRIAIEEDVDGAFVARFTLYGKEYLTRGSSRNLALIEMRVLLRRVRKLGPGYCGLCGAPRDRCCC